MANLHFTVDTTPMAQSVDSVRGHVNGVTTAVTAMEAAVIATERESARTICENVDRGFYFLIKSQISQKLVAAQTEMSARALILVQLGKALDNIKRQMEQDYFMISRRYAKLFQSLNKSLETRVRELDRPAMQLAEIKKSIVFDKYKDNGTAIICMPEDLNTAAGTALGGRLKRKTKAALEALSGQINESASYGEKLGSILLDKEQDFRDDQKPARMDSYLPVIFSSVESGFQRHEYIDNVYTAQREELANTAPMAAEIGNVQERLNWVPAGDDEKSILRKEVAALGEKEALDQRVAAEVLRLFDADTWQTLKEIP
ncbi:MAG: hypothetical protein LBG07_04050 [Treponema sp.]|jgi:hypothetical protein|nr:hypothetical protein [Treponema sp.]